MVSLPSVPAEQARTVAGRDGGREQPPAGSPLLGPSGLPWPSPQGNDPKTLRFWEKGEGCDWKKCAEVIRFASKSASVGGYGASELLQSCWGSFLIGNGAHSQLCLWQWVPRGSPGLQDTEPRLLSLAHPSCASDWLPDPQFSAPPRASVGLSVKGGQHCSHHRAQVRRSH